AGRAEHGRRAAHRARCRAGPLRFRSRCRSRRHGGRGLSPRHGDHFTGKRPRRLPLGTGSLGCAGGNGIRRVQGDGGVSSFDTLRWRDGRLEMLDQRALPSRTVYLGFDSARAVAEGIRAMVVRGAPAIGCAAAYGIALEALRLQNAGAAEFQAGLALAHQELGGSRPTAVNLFWALGRMRDRESTLHGADPAAMAEGLLREAHAIATEDAQLNRA